MGVLFFLRDRDVWKRDLDILVHIPVFLLNAVWIVRVGERDGHAEGSGRGTFADMIIEELFASGSG